MSITQKQFGTLDGQDVISFILDNGCGLKAEILNLGGIIRRLIFKGTDVVLARENVHDCYIDDAYMGALIGRTANRINGGEFILNGKKYTLAKNDSGVSCLHGGNIGFNKKIWTVTASDSAEPQLVLETSAADGEEGYPGNVNVKVTYTLTKENSIKIHYEGTTDADTLLKNLSSFVLICGGRLMQPVGVGKLSPFILFCNASSSQPCTQNAGRRLFKIKYITIDIE